jgi:hypothetical protein
MVDLPSEPRLKKLPIGIEMRLTVALQHSIPLGIEGAGATQTPAEAQDHPPSRPAAPTSSCPRCHAGWHRSRPTLLCPPTHRGNAESVADTGSRPAVRQPPDCARRMGAGSNRVESSVIAVGCMPALCPFASLARSAGAGAFVRLRQGGAPMLSPFQMSRVRQTAGVSSWICKPPSRLAPKPRRRRKPARPARSRPAIWRSAPWRWLSLPASAGRRCTARRRPPSPPKWCLASPRRSPARWCSGTTMSAASPPARASRCAPRRRADHRASLP